MVCVSSSGIGMPQVRRFLSREIEKSSIPSSTKSIIFFLHYFGLFGGMQRTKTIHQILLRNELFAANAVEPPVYFFINIPFLVAKAPKFLRGLDMLRTGSPYKIIIRKI